MVRRQVWWLGGAVLAIAAAVTLGVTLYQSEKQGRQGSYSTPEASSPDYVEILANVQKADATARELVLRVLVVPSGKYSEGEGTLFPTQEIDVESTSLVKGTLKFPAGERIARQDLAMDLSGEVTDYPFDHYQGVAEFAVTIDGKPVPTVVRISDLDPFFNTYAEPATTEGLTGFTLTLDRTQATLVLSWFMMISMWALALSVLAAAWLLTSKKRGMIWPALGWMAATLFALAAFRNTAPGAPPFGCLLDYTSFLWAEAVIAVSVVLVVFRGIRHESALEG